MENKKCYVVTTLIDNEYDKTEVNVCGIKRDLESTKNLTIQLKDEVIENYEENDIEYEVEELFNGFIVRSNEEIISIEYQESEVQE